MLKLSNFDFSALVDYIKFRQLEEPLTSRNISIFEGCNIDTELFETDEVYHDYIADLYKEVLEKVNLKHPDFEVFYLWDEKIKNYYNTENGLPMNLILLLKFSPETVSFLEKMYQLVETGQVEEFMKNFRAKYYPSDDKLFVKSTSEIIKMTYDANFIGNINFVKNAFGWLDPEEHSQLFYQISSVDNLELIKYLYTNFKIDDMSVNFSLISASELGYFDIVEYLLTLKKYDTQTIFDAYYNAIKKGYLSIVKLLLATNMVTDEDIDEGFTKAIENEYLKLAKVLLSTGKVTIGSINYAYRWTNSEPVEEFLLSTGVILTNTFQQNQELYESQYQE